MIIKFWYSLNFIHIIQRQKVRDSLKIRILHSFQKDWKFLCYNNQTLISQNLTILGLLGENFIFSIPWDLKLKRLWLDNLQNKVTLNQSFKAIPEGQDSDSWSRKCIDFFDFKYFFNLAIELPHNVIYNTYTERRSAYENCIIDNRHCIVFSF